MNTEVKSVTEVESPGDALRRARTQQNLSQGKLAEALKVSMSLVNRWENGHRTPQPAEASELQKMFEIPAWRWKHDAEYKIAFAYASISTRIKKPNMTHFALAAALISNEINNISDFSKSLEIFGGNLEKAPAMDALRDLVSSGIFVQDSDGYKLVF